MITNLNLPIVMIVCLVFSLACGVFVAAFGKKTPKAGAWLIWSGLLVMVTGLGLSWSRLMKGESLGEPWVRGWVWPRDEVGAIVVGVLSDPMGIWMAILAVLISSVLMIDQGYLQDEKKPERIYGAVLISTVGLAFSWIAATPWCGLAGLAVSVLGGFIALGSQWHSDSEAALAVRFARERTWGLIVSFLGACILGTHKGHLLWGEAIEWAQPDSLGLVLLSLGLFIQLQSAPMMGWVVSKSGVPVVARIVLAQVFPSWAAFAALVRLVPQLEAQGLSNVLGWISLASAILSVATGLFQQEWKAGLGSWISSGLALAVAALMLAGPDSALVIAVGVGLGAIAFAVAASHVSESSREKGTKATWASAYGFLGVAAGTGGILFASSGGVLSWVAQAWGRPIQGAVSVFAFFIFSLQGWSLAWGSVKRRGGYSAGWVAVVSPLLLLLLSLGVLWDGSITGGALLDSVDSVAPALLGFFFKKREALDHSSFAIASWAHWSVVFVSLGGAFWMSGRKVDLWQELARIFPRSIRFLARGFEFDRLASAVEKGIRWLGFVIVRLFDQKIWDRWVPWALNGAIQRGAGAVVLMDEKMSLRFAAVMRRTVDVPAKVLQLIQSGDVQWYLMFGIGSGFALLLHFLRI